MKIEDIKEQKIMSTELKKLNLVIKLLLLIIMLVIVMFGFQIFTFSNYTKSKYGCITQSDVTQFNEEIKDIKKKVHFRYFNLTRSLEDIHNVKINTENGHVIK